MFLIGSEKIWREGFKAVVCCTRCMVIFINQNITLFILINQKVPVMSGFSPGEGAQEWGEPAFSQSLGGRWIIWGYFQHMCIVFSRSSTQLPLQFTLYPGTCPYLLVNEIFSAKPLPSSLGTSALCFVALGGEGSAAGAPGFRLLAEQPVPGGMWSHLHILKIRILKWSWKWDDFPRIQESEGIPRKY